jgi:hypothetical protein
LSGDDNKPIGKSGQRKRNTRQEGKKADPRKRKSVQPQEPQREQFQDALEAVSTPVTSTGDFPTDISPVDSAPADTSPAVPVTSQEPAPVASVEAAPVSYQAIANAYCNYTFQSLDQTRSFFEKLAAVRSPGKAFELQSEFARQAYEGFTTESQKISELHGELAKQRVKRWEDFVARMIGPSLNPVRQA